MIHQIIMSIFVLIVFVLIAVGLLERAGEVTKKIEDKNCVIVEESLLQKKYLCDDGTVIKR